jgi:AraC-like DNA-binding protein
MTELDVKLQLDTATANVRDIVCGGGCKHASAVECAQTTFLVFPYRGVYVRHVGRDDSVAESNQVLFFNRGEEYRISHPVEGGDACLSIGVADQWLDELAPRQQLSDRGGLAFKRQRLRLDESAQAMVATLRYSLERKVAEPLQAETQTLALIRQALGARTSEAAGASASKQKLVDRAKLLLSADPMRRWTLGEIGAEVGVSPVYLTQLFRQVEGMPLYRYQLRLRLACALDLLGRCEDLTRLSLDLGFSSHSHFTAAFRQTYGRTPAEFQRSVRLR